MLKCLPQTANEYNSALLSFKFKVCTVTLSFLTVEYAKPFGSKGMTWTVVEAGYTTELSVSTLVLSTGVGIVAVIVSSSKMAVEFSL